MRAQDSGEKGGNGINREPSSVSENFNIQD